MHDGHQSLSAGVDNAGLLQNRQHIRRDAQDIIAVFDNLLQCFLEVIDAGQHVRCPFRHTARNREDCTFLRLHDRLVCRLARPCKCLRCHLAVDRVNTLECFGKTAEQLRKDNT